MKPPSDPIPAFLALVLDGRPIQGYGPRCPTCGVGPGPKTEPDRKEMFLKLGTAVLRSLSPGGPAISGDIILVTSEIQISMSHNIPRDSYGDFCAFVRQSDVEWFRWEDLENALAFVKSVDRLLRPEPVPASEPAFDPFEL